MNGVILGAECLVCNTAFTGLFGALSRLGGVSRGAGNPNLCNRCNGHVEDGKIVEIAVFFADLSGYTSMTETLGPERVHELLDRFLRGARDEIVNAEGYVSQFFGGEVMAFFNAPLRRPNFASLAVEAAVSLQRTMVQLSFELDHPMQVTIGIAQGFARVGQVGSEQIAHYSAIGDVVNRAARLVSRVSPGGILVDDQVYAVVSTEFPDAICETVELKGFSEPVTVALIEGASVGDDSHTKTTRRANSARLATTLAAILSAPCARFLALNSAGLAFGFGALSMGAIAKFFDQSLVRIPLQDSQPSVP
ncbi:MAG: class 3 adenylate cyclase [Gammaproteobacteria bacterium]|jgi:class 3 adenylate cyclase